MGNFSVEEKWVLLIVDSQMATGEYANALKTIDEGLKRFPNSIRIRYAGIEVCNFNNQVDRSLKMFGEIGDMASSSAWRYRDPANQIVLGKCFLKAGADAKDVLDKFYTPVKKRYATNPEVYRAIGELALQKHDFALAAENYAKVLELRDKDIDALGQLATAFRQSDSEKANEKVQLALKINPNHVPSLLIAADGFISAEDYDQANKTLDDVIKINPHHPEAWAYKAAIAHLQNDPSKEGEYRSKALTHYKSNAMVDYLIGRELSEKYRFAEGEKYQRLSLIHI